MAGLEAKFEQWKNKLLDLGKRNRLLNYRETKRSSLRIITPDMENLWKQIVISELPLVFDYYDDDIETNEDTDQENEFIKKSKLKDDRNVITNQKLNEQQKTLRNLRNKAKISMQEQGVNILYLSFGFLKWSESSRSDQYFNAPIILVPVTLYQESITSPYILRLHEDEIVVNPTLAYKLGNDFGIAFPEYDEDSNLKQFLQSLEALIPNNMGWKVISEVGLSFLSFLKISMFRDLELHKDKIMSNSIVRALGGDISALNTDVDFVNDYDHDTKSSPTETFQVIDADSSQQDAIILAKKGISFILQGPPGTGKSQTITNIIAESLAAGKKVLFVSEKMAALDVVQRRLVDADLDKFCLVLHSYKAKKKEVIEELSSVLSLSKNKVEIDDEILMNLDRLQEHKYSLNNYSKSLFIKTSPLDLTIYSVHGNLANLNQFEDIIFSIDNILKITKSKFNRIIIALSRYAELVGEKSGAYILNPWYGANVETITNDLRHNISVNLEKLEKVIKENVIGIYELCDDICERKDVTYLGLNKIIKSLEYIKPNSTLPQSWSSSKVVLEASGNLHKYRLMCEEIKNDISSYIETASKVTDLTSNKQIETLLDVEDKIGDITNLVNMSVYANWGNKYTVNDISDFAKKFGDIVNIKEKNRQELIVAFTEEVFNFDHLSLQKKIIMFSTKKFASTMNELKEYTHLISSYRIHKPEINEIEELRSIMNQLVLCNKLTSEIDELSGKIKIYEDSIMNIKNYTGILADKFEGDIFAIDFREIMLRFKNQYKTMFKFLNSEFKKDMKLFSVLSRSIKSKITYDEVVNALELLRSLDEEKTRMNQNSDDYNIYMRKNEELRELENNISHSYQISLREINSEDINNKISKICDNRFNTVYQEYFTSFIDVDKIIVKKEGLSLFNLDSVIETFEFIVTKIEANEKFNQSINSMSPKFEEYFGFVPIKNNSDIYKQIEISDIFSEINVARTILENVKNNMMILQSESDITDKLYGFLYDGYSTNWDDIEAKLSWVKEFEEIHDGIIFKSAFTTAIYNGDINKYTDIKGELSKFKRKIKKELEWFSSLFESNYDLQSIPLELLGSKASNCHSDIASLEKWIDLQVIRSKCSKEGLDIFLSEIDKNPIKSDDIVKVYKKRFYTLWLDAVLPKHPAVINFRRKNHENLIKDFSELDTLQFRIAKARIKKKLYDSLPSLGRFTSSTDEISILNRELAKKRKIKPIRKLFKEIPNLLLTIKPCLMMSPLSVSLFLDSDTYLFDTVIFDEASQVCTENAIGAISRAKQVIIAGDSKQLPPTNFFAANTNGVDFDVSEDEELDDDLGAYESILDEASMLPQKTLLWHYRSRHEHLIAFSNAKIYKNNLITFPSNIDKIPDNGVEYFHVADGYYDRGGKKGNIVEAKKVAEIIFDHFSRFPGRSLGVIAFGEAQQQAIDAAVRQMRKENKEYEIFFKEDSLEPFFIKNLENVQGDERDTIIFSIGYAKDASGKMSMNFGPLSRSGGERRLNVAITRAKYNVKLVGSILPTDIKSQDISSEGAKLLRSYIEFAQQGISALLAETSESEFTQHDSPFEEAVYRFLEQKGFKLGTQIGCSGYKIDMAVKHPDLDGIYILGIECDGASYHSARTARERDRLRQDVLENMGWKIYRIWSTDWIKDPVTEGESLVRRIETAIEEYGINEEILYENAWKSPPKEHKDDNLITISKKVETRELAENPYDFEKEVITDFQNLPVDIYGFMDLKDCIMAVIENESPVHYDVLCKRLTPLFGNEKTTARIRRAVDSALKYKVDIIRKNDFFYPIYGRNIVPKAVNNTRKIENISIEELAEAMANIARKCIGVSKDSLFAETARAYGFGKVGSKILSVLQSAFDQLIIDGMAYEDEGKVLI